MPASLLTTRVVWIVNFLLKIGKEAGMKSLLLKYRKFRLSVFKGLVWTVE